MFTSGTAMTFFSIIIALLLGLTTATWRVGNKIGGMAHDITGHAKRIERLEENEDAHDRWHLRRGDK